MLRQTVYTFHCCLQMTAS